MFHLGSEGLNRLRHSDLVVRLNVSSKVCDAGKLSFVFGGATARSPDFWNLVLYLKRK